VRVKQLLILFFFFILIPIKGFSESKTRFDEYQERASARLISLSNSVDYFFGGLRVDEESNSTLARFSLTSSLVEYEGADQRVDFRLRLDLPGTKKRFQLIFEDEEDDNSSSSEGNVGSESDLDGQETGFNAALRYMVTAKQNWNFQTDLGLRIRRTRPLNPYLRLRARRSFYFGKWEWRNVQEIYFLARTGDESKTYIDFDRALPNDLLFRYGTGFEWNDDVDFFVFSTGPSLFQKLTDTSAISYSIKASGDNREKSTFTNYEFFVKYRKLIHSNWLYLELTPGVSYPKDEDWRRTPFLIVKFESLLGSV
jgi:hypothetical protein